MNVKSLKEVFPLAEAYEFSESGRYIVALSVHDFHPQMRENLSGMLPANAVVAAVASDPHDALAVYKANFESTKFAEVVFKLSGACWTQEQAAELHRLIDTGTEPVKVSK